MASFSGKKCIFQVFNYILLFFGLLILSSGVAIGLIFGDICTDKYQIPLSLGIIMEGAIIITVQLVGCCGSRTMNKCLLGTFSFLILLVLIMGIILTIFFVKFNSQIADFTQNCLVETIGEYNRTKTAQGLIDNLQQKMQCCGIKGKSDWGKNIPNSCCQDPSVNNCTSVDKNIFESGCYEILINKLKSFSPVVIGTAAVIILIEVVLFVMSCFFMKQKSSSKEE